MNARKLFISSLAVCMFGLAPALFAEPSDNPAVPPKPEDNGPAMNQKMTPPNGAPQMCDQKQPKEQANHREGFPGMQRKQFGKMHQGFGFMPRSPMSEDDMAKFADLGMKLKDAVEDYRTTSDEKSKAAVKNAITALVDAQQQFEIDRCEKALARAKAKVQEKENIIDRMLKHLTAPKAEKPGMKGAPRHGADGNRPMPQDAPDKE